MTGHTLQFPGSRGQSLWNQSFRLGPLPLQRTPAGLRCVNCGRCEVGPAKIFAEDLGYRFFLAPGSSVIKRMIKKYRPRAIVGVGCPMEIKEGLELCQGHDIPAIGVPLLTNGCVSTTLDWGRFYEVISDRRAAAPPREEEAEIGIFSRM